MKDLKDVAVSINGQRYGVMAGVPTGEPNRCIYLLGTLGENTEHSLWSVEFTNDGKGTIIFWPYEGGI